MYEEAYHLQSKPNKPVRRAMYGSHMQGTSSRGVGIGRSGRWVTGLGRAAGLDRGLSLSSLGEGGKAGDASLFPGFRGTLRRSCHGFGGQ